MNRETIIGIDPGATGGVAVIRPDGVVETYKLEALTERDVVDLLRGCCPGVAYLEQVSAGGKQPPRHAFKFGASYGGLRVAVVAADGLRLETVTPKTWATVLRLPKLGGSLGENHSKAKRRNKQRAQEIYPGLKVINATADALLLAEFGRIRENYPRPERVAV